MTKELSWYHVIIFAICACAVPVTGQCSGTVLELIATDEYQVFTSVNYPNGYGNDRDCTWHIEADNVTDAIRLEITDISIEFHANCVYDYGEVFDGSNYTDDSLGKFCGTTTSDYVSTYNYMTVRFKSDYSLYSKGFKARYKSGPRASLLDDESSTETISSLVIIGASVGAMAFIIFIIGVTFTYIQLKKAKEFRRHRLRGMNTRVEPMEYGNWSYLDGPAPPAYGEIYSSPMSPPPMYSEVDPNPNPADRLPGRAEYMDDNRTTNSNTRAAEASTQPNRGDTNANTHFVTTNSIRTSSGRQGGAITDIQQITNTNALDDTMNLPGSVPPSAHTTPSHRTASNTTTNIVIPTAGDSFTNNNAATNVPNVPDPSPQTTTVANANVTNVRSTVNGQSESLQPSTPSAQQTNVISTTQLNQPSSLPNAV